MKWLKFITDEPSTPKGVEKAQSQPTTGIYYDTNWAHKPVAKFVRKLGVWGFMKPAINLYGSPKIIGADRLKDVTGPVIFVANHHSHADTTLLLATIPAHLRKNLSIAAGADYFFPNKFAAMVSALFIGAIPIERQKLSKLSIKNTMDAIKNGNNLLIFPEGGRSPDGWSRKHKPGAAFIAKQTKVPVIPTYINGTGQILPKGKNWPTKSKCAVVFGKPIHVGASEDPRDFAVRSQSKIDELADEFESGWWKAIRNAHDKSTPSLTGPEVGAWRRRWATGPRPGSDRLRPKKQTWPK